MKLIAPLLISAGVLFLLIGIAYPKADDQCLKNLNWSIDNFEPCRAYSSGGVSWTVDSLKIEEDRLPYILTRSNIARPSGIVIDLMGGPGDIISFSGLKDHYSGLLYNIAKSGYEVYTPAYAGSAHRSNFPNEGLKSAGSEISELSKALSKEYPNIPQCFLASSLGGYILLYQKSIEQNKKFVSRNSVFINPLFSSPKVRYDAAMVLSHLGDDPKTSPRRRFFYKSIYQRNIGPNGKIQVKEQRVLEDELFKSFFGDSFEKSSNLNISKSFGSFIFYSKKDTERTSENYAFYVKLLNTTLVPINTSKHIISEDKNYERYISQITQAVKESCVL